MTFELTDPDILDGLEKTMKELCMERDEAVMAMLREGMSKLGYDRREVWVEDWLED